MCIQQSQECSGTIGMRIHDVPTGWKNMSGRSTYSLYIISYLFFQLCFLTTRISSCGMSTHIDIAHQAINWFKDTRNGTDYRDLILRHQDAFIGGNPYPDAMYPSFCFGGKFHSIAEDTHWAPFLNATIRYIRKKYPKPWDQVCEKYCT